MKRKPAKSSREERVNFLYITKHEECCVSESISRERESDLERREKGWERPLVTTYRRTDLNERPGQGRVLCQEGEPQTRAQRWLEHRVVVSVMQGRLLPIPLPPKFQGNSEGNPEINHPWNTRLRLNHVIGIHEP